MFLKKQNKNPIFFLLNKKKKPYLLKGGQIIIETVFFIICILSFLSAIQFFQVLSRKEIQKQRLTRQSLYKTKNLKASWYKKILNREK